MAGYHRLTLLLIQGEGFARVLIFFHSVGLPLFDCGAASVGLPLILYDRIFAETLRYSFGVALVGVEKPDRANDPRYDSARRGAARDNFDAGGTT